MTNFFGKNRKKILSKGKSGKYLKYALGEIVLVVIGILIALQINHTSEVSKEKKQVITYEKNIASELRNDLYMLDKLDSINSVCSEKIINYISYFKSPTKDHDVLTQKMSEINYHGAVYRSIAYTIDDIISTGNLSLFSLEKKTAILEFKSIQEFFEKNRIEVEQKWVLSNMEFENSVDLISFKDYPSGEYKNLNSWRHNFKSDQYRLFNNKALAELRVYYFRTDQNRQIRIHTEKLLDLLDNN